MPYRKLPNSVPAVIRTLKAARDEWKNTPLAADRAINHCRPLGQTRRRQPGEPP